ncbi:MAG: DUF1018 domain-containing protein [Actinomycetota bacterium]|nr:DUF1018 domain-containing protein [Actinomycetota bacterium]
MSDITRGQQAKLHIAAKELKLSKDQYKAILFKHGHTFTSQRLTETEADAVLTEFKEMGWRPKSAKSPRKGGEVYHHNSSLKGLKEEIKEYALKRWGQGYERPLLALAKKIYGEIDHFDWIESLWHLKRIKETILRMQAKGSYTQHQRREALNQEDPF